MTTRVKICGITREEDVHLASRFGADALGFVYGHKGSPRNISSFELLRQLVNAVPPFVSSVVVTPTTNPELSDIVFGIRPTLIQLDGMPSRSLAKARFIIQTVYVEEKVKVQEMVARCKTLSSSSKAILLDLKKAARNGGSAPSITQDWHLSRKIRDALDPRPVILAGGLTKSNVARAIKLVKPYAVDVSSGVETSEPGIKDEGELKEFIRIAKDS